MGETVADIASWMVEELGYPFDVATSVPPPMALRVAIEAEWVRRDAATPEEAVDVRRTVAEEGGWGHGGEGD